MKKTITFLMLLFASYSLALELSIDTINAGVTQLLSQPNYVEGELKTLYVNSSNDTLRFDSARVDLIKSETGQYQMGPVVCSFTDIGANAKTFYFWNYDEDLPMGDNNVNNFKFDLKPNESVFIQIENFDYRTFGLIPEGTAGLKSLNPPQPIQAKMTCFTNKGSDSIIINGMQTNQPASSTISGRRMPVTGGATVGQTDYYTINGKRINLSSIKKSTLSKGVGIAVEKSPDGSFSCRKNILTR